MQGDFIYLFLSTTSPSIEYFSRLDDTQLPIKALNTLQHEKVHITIHCSNPLFTYILLLLPHPRIWASQSQVYSHLPWFPSYTFMQSPLSFRDLSRNVSLFRDFPHLRCLLCFDPVQGGPIQGFVMSNMLVARILLCIRGFLVLLLCTTPCWLWYPLYCSAMFLSALGITLSSPYLPTVVSIMRTWVQLSSAGYSDPLSVWYLLTILPDIIPFLHPILGVPTYLSCISNIEPSRWMHVSYPLCARRVVPLHLFCLSVTGHRASDRSLVGHMWVLVVLLFFFLHAGFLLNCVFCRSGKVPNWGKLIISGKK